MPRKRADEKEQSQDFNKAFPATLRKLMRESSVTQQMLTDYLGKKNRQTVSYYCDGTSSPDWETIVKIADYFNISTDYLLGRTSEPSRQPSAADDLGLSPEAVFNLRRFCKDPWNNKPEDDIAPGINAMLEQAGIFQIACEILKLQKGVEQFLSQIEAVSQEKNPHIGKNAPKDWYGFVLRMRTEIQAEDMKKFLLASYGQDIDPSFEILCGRDAVIFRKQKIQAAFESILDQLTNYTAFEEQAINRKGKIYVQPFKNSED